MAPRTILACILIVEDDERLRERLARAFRDRGYRVHTAHDHASALAALDAEVPEYAVVDLRMPGPSGLELVRDLATREPGMRIVLLTGYGSIATAVDAVKLGACDVLQKPADADMILAAFDRAEGDPLEGTEVEYVPPSLARVEWEHIKRVLADCGGNISKAARRLGVHRRTLQRKLQKYPPRG